MDYKILSQHKVIESTWHYEATLDFDSQAEADEYCRMLGDSSSYRYRCYPIRKNSDGSIDMSLKGR